MSNLSDDSYKVKKRNRLQKQTPKKHQIKTISGRSTLKLQETIINKAKRARKKK